MGLATQCLTTQSTSNAFSSTVFFPAQSETSENWINGGASPAKTLVGLATYGRTFTLADPTDTGPGARARGAGTAGTYSAEKGFLTYYEVRRAS